MKLLFISYSAILAIVATSLAYLGIESMDLFNAMLISYLAQAILFILTIKRENEGKMQFLRPFFILLIGMTIVNFQVIIDTLYSAFRTELTIWGFQRYIGKCLYLGVIAQTSLTIGYVFHNHRDYNSLNPENENDEETTDFDIPRYLWGFFLLVLFAAFIVTIDVQAFLRGDSTVNDGSFDRKVGTLSLYSELLLNVFFVIVISVVARNLSKEEDRSIKRFLASFPIIFWCVFLSYLILRLFSGDRGPVIYNLATLLFAYIYATKRVFSISSLVALLIISALGMTLIGIARKKASTMSYEAKLAYAIEEFSKSGSQSYIPATVELGSSVKVTALAIRGIERESIEQGYGRYNLMAWTSAIPFSSKLIYALFPSLKEKGFVASEVLTVEGYGKHYSSGLGNTSIADIYIDFGIIGVLIFFILFGFIFKRIDDVIIYKKNVSPYLLTFTLYMSSHAIYIGRSSFSFIMANACLYILVQYLLYFMIRFFNFKKHV